MTVYFVGWYQHANCGDEAFKEVHKLLLPAEEKVWVTDDVKVIENYKPGDVFVLGGGDVFLDYYITRIPSEQKFFVYGVGLGGASQISRVVELRHRIQGLWLRSRSDVEALRALGVDARYTPDIAFQLRENVRSAPRADQGGRKRLVVMPSNGHAQFSEINGDFRKFFYSSYLRHELALRLSELAQYYDITFLPLCFDEVDYDLSFVRGVYALMTQRKGVTIIEDALEPIEAARCVAASRLAISMKYHGLVFAAMAGVPFINIGLTRKTLLLCEENGCSDLIATLTPAENDRFRRLVKTAESEAVAKRLAALSSSLAELAITEGLRFRDAVQAVHRPL